jgi:hypothetical protein
MGGRLQIAHQSYDWPIRNREQQHSQIYYTYSVTGAQLYCALFQPQQVVETRRSAKPFSWTQPACFNFSSSNFNVQADSPPRPGAHPPIRPPIAVPYPVSRSPHPFKHRSDVTLSVQNGRVSCTPVCRPLPGFALAAPGSNAGRVWPRRYRTGVW